MTIKRAKEILGKEAKGKTDKEIMDLVGVLTALADVGFEQLERRLDKHEKKSP